MQSVEEILNKKTENLKEKKRSNLNAGLIIKSLLKNLIYVVGCFILIYFVSTFDLQSTLAIKQEFFLKNRILVGENFKVSKKDGKEDKISGDYRVQDGDVIKTDKSTKGEIAFETGEILRLDENSEVEILNVEEKNFGKHFDIQINKGRIWINNILNRSTFKIFSSYVAITPNASQMSVSYDSMKEELYIFSIRDSALISFVSKSVNKNKNRSLLEEKNYLNHILIPEENFILIKEKAITDNFLQAKYLKLLKNVQMNRIGDKFKYKDWLVYNDSLDEKNYELRKSFSIASIKNSNVNFINDEIGFWSKFADKLIIFPQKKYSMQKKNIISSLKEAEKKMIENNAVEGKKSVEIFISGYNDLKLANADFKASADEVGDLLEDEYFKLFFVETDDPLFDLREKLKEFLVEYLTLDEDKVLFKLNILNEILNSIHAKIPFKNLEEIDKSKKLFDKYKTIITDPSYLNSVKKLDDKIDYLIRERHKLVNLIKSSPEFYEKNYFDIVVFLEEKIKESSEEIVDEDDNRLYFRSENLEFYSDLIKALKQNSGNRYKIIELGKFLNQRNEKLIPSKLKIEDNPKFIALENEFMNIADYINSDFFKDIYREEDYKRFINDQKNMESYLSSEDKKQGNRTPVDKIDIKNLTKKVKEDFTAFGYNVNDIKSLDTRGIKFFVNNFKVEAKTVSVKYNLNSKFGYDLVYAGKIHSGEFKLEYLFSVLENLEKKPQVNSGNNEENDGGGPSVSRAEKIAILTAKDKLEKNKILISEEGEIKVFDYQQHYFLINKAFGPLGDKINFDFKYFENTDEAENIKVYLSDGTVKSIEGKLKIPDLLNKVNEVYFQNELKNF